MKIPEPIFKRIVLLSICLSGLLVVGFIWSFVIKDAITVYLTVAVAILGTIKVFVLYRQTKDTNYDLYEGVISLSRQIPGRSRHIIHLNDGDDVIELCIIGRHHFSVGEEYRIYLQKSSDYDLKLPDILKPGRALLGYERVA